MQIVLILLCCLYGLVWAGKAESCIESCDEGGGGWPKERLDGHCYHWSTTWKSWHRAEAFCKTYNGHLAAVTSSKIHNFLMKKVNADDYKTWFWIGGTDKQQERTWRWIDGSEWKFTNWSSIPHKQPTNIANQDCLQIYSQLNARNGWNDADCHTQVMFICSWKICQANICSVSTESNPDTNISLGNNTSDPTKNVTDIEDGIIVLGFQVPLVAAVLVPLLILLFIVVAITVACILKKRSKENKQQEENVELDENPVYQQYELVGPNYERQYSTHEVVDANTYYES